MDQDELFSGLLENSKDAMRSAIEIYNKPRFGYRNECSSILMINAWELVLKALLVDDGAPIFGSTPKEERIVSLSADRKGVYNPFPRTIRMKDAFDLARSRELLGGLEPLPVWLNLKLLSDFRHNAVHFYSDRRAIRLALLHLAQANVVNFVDLLESQLEEKLVEAANWHTQPLLLNPSRHSGVRQDPELAGAQNAQDSPAVSEFLERVKSARDQVDKAGDEMSRLMLHSNGAA